jgi:hypothetical protein
MKLLLPTCIVLAVNKRIRRTHGTLHGTLYEGNVNKPLAWPTRGYMNKKEVKATSPYHVYTPIYPTFYISPLFREKNPSMSVAHVTGKKSP